MFGRGSVFLFALALLTGGALEPARAPTQAKTDDLRRGLQARDAATLVPSPCPHLSEAVARREHVECGVLIVPERRNGASGGVVRLSVAVLKSRGVDPAPDPILLLPGAAWHGHLLATEAWLESGLRETRDLILVDPRGTGFSVPSLDCPDIRQLQDELRAIDLPPEEIARRFTAAGGDCRDRLVAAGADLPSYDHASAAADLAALRHALGIGRWTVYGIGHGTRLALTVLRDHPEGVRSAILDSVAPPQVDEFRLADRIEGALATILDGCAAAPTCLAAFPDLEADVHALVERLNAEPIVVTTPHPLTGEPTRQLVNGDLVIAGFLQAQAVTEFIPVLPLAARELLGRNADVVAALGGSVAGGPGGIGPLSQGAAYAIRCRDEAAFADPDQAWRDAAATPWLRGLFLRASEQAVCAGWPIGEPDPTEQEPVRSDVPALIVAGEYDSLTLPAWSRMAAATLAEATLVEFPGVGHGPSRNVPCATGIRDAFLADPTRPLDLGCVSAMQPPPFVSDVHVNGGVLRAVRGLVAEPEPVHLAIVTGSGLVFVTALAAWPISQVRVFRRRRRQRAAKDRAVAGLVALAPVGLGLVASVVNLSLIGGFAWFVWRALETTPAVLLFGLPGAAGPLFGLALLSVVLAPVVAAGAALDWARGAAPPLARWHVAAVALAAVAFAGYLGWTGLARL